MADLWSSPGLWPSPVRSAVAWMDAWSIPGLWPRKRPGSGSGSRVTCQVWSSPGLWPRDRPGAGAGSASGGRQPTTWHQRNHCCAPFPNRAPTADVARSSDPGVGSRQHGACGEGPHCRRPQRLSEHAAGWTLTVPETALVDPSVGTAIRIRETTAESANRVPLPTSLGEHSGTITSSRNVTRASSQKVASNRRHRPRAGCLHAVGRGGRGADGDRPLLSPSPAAVGPVPSTPTDQGSRP